MFIDNNDRTFRVRFVKSDRTADYVTVDRFLPVDPETDLLIYARQYRSIGSGRSFDDDANELWAALAEKAFTQWLASGWVAAVIPSASNSVTNSVTNTAINSVANSVSNSETSNSVISSDAQLTLPVDQTPVKFSNRYSDLINVIYSNSLSALTGRSATVRSIDSLAQSNLLLNAVRMLTPVGVVAKPIQKHCGRTLLRAKLTQWLDMMPCKIPLRCLILGDYSINTLIRQIRRLIGNLVKLV